MSSPAIKHAKNFLRKTWDIAAENNLISWRASLKLCKRVWNYAYLWVGIFREWLLKLCTLIVWRWRICCGEDIDGSLQLTQWKFFLRFFESLQVAVLQLLHLKYCTSHPLINTWWILSLSNFTSSLIFTMKFFGQNCKFGINNEFI